ncbi:serine/threonine protein kinase [bacterium]|nr:serine/threonine protein kinase [bacterium]
MTGYQTPPPLDETGPLADAVWEYLKAREDGRPTTDWLSRYPELEDQLQPFLSDPAGVDDRLRALGPARWDRDLATDERFLGDYELVERVGENMGTIYRARHRALAWEAAVKVLARDGDRARDGFRREVEAMARLRHPNVARIRAVPPAADVPYFVMDWYPGGTLADRPDRYARNPEGAARVAAAVARAVHHAHERGVLHRDLKPSNILLDADGRPHVADFGLAVLAGAGEAADPVPAGTPAYMAPEQLAGETTVRSDVHGLGAVLYALLTGGPPYPHADPAVPAAGAGQPPPPRAINPAVDADLDAVCRKCLAPDPAGRYGTAAEAADDLDRWLAGEPVAARPLGPAARAARAVRQARAAAQFARPGPVLLVQAAVVFLNNALAYLLVRAGAAEPLVWAAVFASYLPLLVFGLRNRAVRPGNRAGVRHLWAVGVGHAAGALAVFAAARVAAADTTAWLASGYAGVAGLNVVAFAVLGSLFAGRLYLLAVGWVGGAVGMAAAPALAPLVYAGLMSATTLSAAAHLRAVTSREDGDGG